MQNIEMIDKKLKEIKKKKQESHGSGEKTPENFETVLKALS